MFNFIGAAITGLLVGLAARLLYPGIVPMGWIMTALLGIGGSLLAGMVVSSQTGGIGGGVNRPGCLASVLGAMALIFIGHQLGWHF